MTVPDYQSLMLPLLKLASDGQERRVGEVTEILAQQLHLTEEDRKELLPSGARPRFDDRVIWASTYLRKARLLESTARGVCCISERGRELLKTKPTAITARFLRQFPEFLEFQNPSHHTDEKEEEKGQAVEQTPQETLESSYQNLRRELAQELLERAKKCRPAFFETLVVDLLVAMGYGGSKRDAGAAVGQSGDGGIDGIIKEDKLGLDVVYVQAKRWDSTVGRPLVQAFAGSLDGQRARKGVFITTSQFSQDARDYVSRIEKKIVLIDGEQLAQFMIDHGVGVTEVATYTVKKMDLDYFGDE